ncbi:hypothetical protein [Paenibacillus sp. MBLB4367]|uniref:hypothetical protein n=1 Tax=Paenibacillus sp. MBLB4367 TaxID=3384767 RepID=UPI003907EF57
MVIGKWKNRLTLALGFCLAWGQACSGAAAVSQTASPANAGLQEGNAAGSAVSAAPASGVSSAVAVTAATYGMYEDILNREASWLSGLQLGSGIVPMAPGSGRVVPYFANLALLGLLEKPEQASVVRKYMDWYFAHLNRAGTPDAPAGSIFDYTVGADGQTETASGDFDSTDSYASTFLNVLRKYAAKTGDTAYLQAHRSDIELIAGAMLATKQADGLTWAKPAYRVKYLMDNAEVYKGLLDMEWISGAVFGDEAGAALYRQHKNDVLAGIGGLWSDGKNAFAFAKMEDGGLLLPDWNSFYADATAQLFPIWTGVLAPDSERALQLYNTFNEHHPGWPQLNKPDAFPWAILAYTAAIMGDRVRTDQFLESVKAAYIDRDHPWPWYAMESGMTMLAAAIMKEKPDAPRSWSMGNLQEGAILTALPYTVTGTAESVQDVELRWTNGLTGQTQTFRATAAGGNWQLPIEGLTNGTYTVEASAKDRFANLIASQRLTVTVKVAGSGPAIAKAVVQPDRDVLRRGESTMLRVLAFAEDGRTPVSLEGAQIAYHTDRPELASVDAQGMLTLRALAADVNRLTVWAFVTKGYDVLRTEPLTVSISHEAMTMADDVLDRLSAWIGGRQLANGSITLKADGREIVPEAASIGALGLLLREETVPNVKRYIDWYTSHWAWGDRYGMYGTVDNYRLNANTGQWESAGAYDSASSNIGTFISLLRAHYEKTGEFKLPQSSLDLMTGGVGMMRSQAGDGLMWKLPDAQTKRLRDNALAYKGMSDSVWLFLNRFQAAGPAGYFRSFTDFLHDGIQSELWNPGAGSYYLALNERGEGQPPSWSVKPEAAGQLAVVYTGVVSPDSETARNLYAAYNRSFPGWSGVDALSGTDAAVAYAAALMGDRTRASAYLGRLLDALKADRLPADWTVEHAGNAMLAAELVKTMPAAAVVAIDKPDDGDLVKNGSIKAKGTVSGAVRIRVEWREKYGSAKGREEIDVRKKNGKWQLTLDHLRIGSSYELTVYALDERGYPLPGTARSVTAQVGGKPRDR